MVSALLTTAILLILGVFWPIILSAQIPRVRAVVVGVRLYPRSPATKSLLYSDNDARLVEEFFRTRSPARFAARDISVLTDDAAGLHQMNIAFRKALLGAGSGDYVYLFISARGVARPNAAEGYIGNSELVEVKPESTGLPVSDLKEMIRYSRAARVFLFADVCRDPASLPFENRINLRLEELGDIPKFAGILASERTLPSFEKRDLPPETPRGLGVFTYVLIKGMPPSGAVQVAGSNQNIARLFAELKNSLPAVSAPNRQAPYQIGRSLEVRNAPLWPSSPSQCWLTHPALLASAWFQPGLLASPQATDSERILQLDRLRNPEQVAEEVEQLQAARDSESWEVLRDRAAAKLSARGQIVVSAYGVEDLLPEDPAKLREEDFRLAARSFAAASRILKSDALFDSYRRQLDGLSRFCQGRAMAFDPGRLAGARQELNSAKNAMVRPIPEIENALGITYLDEGSDYAAAVEHFRNAKREAPGWPYPRHNLALAYAEQGNYRAAEREYREAIRQMPDQPYLRYNLGLLLQKMNRSKQAAAELANTITTLEVSAKEYTSRSDDWRSTFPEESRLARERAVLLLRSRADAENTLAAVRESLGDVAGAKQAYRRAVEDDPALCPPRHNLALLLGRLGDAAGIVLLEENTARCPLFHPSFVALAKEYLKQGQRDRSRIALEHALKLAPENTESSLLLSGILAHGGQFDRAAETLTASIRLEVEAQNQAGVTRGGANAMAQPALYVKLASIYEAQGHPQTCAAYRDALLALKGAAQPAERRRIAAKVKLCGR